MKRKIENTEISCCTRSRWPCVHRIKIFFLNLSPITPHLFLELQHEKETILLHYALRVCARAAKKARGVVRVALSASVTFQNQNWTLRLYIFLTKLARAYFQDGIRTWLTNKYMYLILYFIYFNVCACAEQLLWPQGLFIYTVAFLVAVVLHFSMWLFHMYRTIYRRGS